MTKGKLLFAANADSYYATKEYFPDPYLYLEDKEGKKHGCFNGLEIDRAKANAKLDHIHSLESVMKILKDEDKTVSMTTVIKQLLEMTDTNDVIVAKDFPANLYKGLTDLGVNIEIQDMLFPSRVIKSAEEIEKIRQAQSINEEGFKVAFDILHNSTIADDEKLIWKDKTLTAEILRNQMNAVIAAAGGIANEGGPIVACGVQGSQPHEMGHGALYANQLIVIDSYPRHSNLYYGDLTRTVLKGKASKTQEKMYQSVKTAQELGVNMIKTGVVASTIHEAIEAQFIADGFKTEIDKNGNNVGFIHSTGHNVGLDLHDVGPGISKHNNLLETNQVVTVEPGLYYPEIGGVRIEDIVAVTEDGPNNLTTLEKFLTID
jgi:Xaa-Pro aminopeptidase